MTAKKTKKVVKKADKKSGSGNAGAVVLGTMAIGALAGYIFWGSKNAPKNRKNLKGWVLKAKGEVLERVEKTKEASEAQYHKIVDDVLRKYEATKSIDTKEVKALGKDLKKHWLAFSKEIKKVKKA